MDESRAGGGVAACDAACLVIGMAALGSVRDLLRRRGRSVSKGIWLSVSQVAATVRRRCLVSGQERVGAGRVDERRLGRQMECAEGFLDDFALADGRDDGL